MSRAAPGFSQIKAQVAAVRRRQADARVIGIRSRERWTGEPLQQDGDETYLIIQCDSPLAMRAALRSGDATHTKVLITDLDDSSISEDILLRLWSRKLIPLDSWQIVKSLFQARSIDPRLARHSWLADTLMELPSHLLTPVAGGFLDAETVWPLLLRQRLQLDVDVPDLMNLLRWSTSNEHVTALQAETPEFRDAAAEWLAGLAGPAAITILQAIAAYARADAVPVGLAAAVIFHHESTGKLDKAIGRLEAKWLNFPAAQPPDPAHLAAWSAAATDVVRLGISDLRLKQQLLNRADELQEELGATAFAWLSDTSPTGFDLRLSRFGQQLQQTISQESVPTMADMASLEEARQRIVQHDRAGLEKRRLERLEMSLRLLRWLQQPAVPESPSLTDAASRYLQEGGYLDWARLSLRSGDPERELSAAYARLFERVTSHTEQVSHSFAEQLRDWTAADTSTGPALLPVEQVLEQLVAPLAAAEKLLVIVIDGMSVPVYRELLQDTLGQDWTPLTPIAGPMPAALATVPSLTECSRTSLLTGKRQRGNQSTEQAQFPQHPALLQHCRSGYPPVIFHKGALQQSEDASLAAEVRNEINSSHRRIVAVVVNAVDDHLSKGEQIDTRWTRDEIRVLPVLLHEARINRRTVVLISDHGHVLDCGMQMQPQDDGGERWRTATSEPNDGELLLQGPRVVLPETHQLIAPWSEKLRYVPRRNGYHGGISPQEMVIPIAVLSSQDTPPKGWTEATPDLPQWWTASSPTTTFAPVPQLKPQPRRNPDQLFDTAEEPHLTGNVAALTPAGDTATAPATTTSQAADTGSAVQIPEWILAFLRSPILDEQKQHAGRSVPADAVLCTLLTVLEARGGKMTCTALGLAMNMGLPRLRGTLAVTQRILNVDGYAIFTRDAASDTVELNRNLLLRQFDLI